MNWGQIQIESLKKMFLNKEELTINNLNEYKQDKKYKTYLFAMPQAANEAINIILENVQPLIKKYVLKKKEDTERYDLNKLSNFKKVYQIVNDGGTYEGYELEGNNQLVIKNWSSGQIIVYYESYPDLLTSSSSSSTDLEIPIPLTVAIPLYIAGELYKDDDVQLSTIYMNEFYQTIQNFQGHNYNPIPNNIQTIYSGDY